VKSANFTANFIEAFDRLAQGMKITRFRRLSSPSLWDPGS
jgi:hypothetical protein